MGKLFLSLVYIEWIKLKNANVALLCTVCATSVAFLQLGATLAQRDIIARRGWDAFWADSLNIWVFMMLPLLISLICVRLNQIEQNNGGFQLMHTLPLKGWVWYLSKLVVAKTITVFTCVCFFILLAAGMWILSLLGHQSAAPLSLNLSAIFTAMLITCIPIIATAFLLSWYVRNGVIVIGLCFALTIAANIMMRSEQYWYFHPWTYLSVNYLIQIEHVKNVALLLSLISGGILILVGSIAATKHQFLTIKNSLT